MANKPKQIRFEEDGFEDWSDSPASPLPSPTPSVGSFHRGSRPKQGTTRIPSRIVSKRALIELEYPFAEDGDTIVVQLALGEDHITELLELSKRIRSSDQGTSEVGDNGEFDQQERDRGFDWINVDAHAPETPSPNARRGEEFYEDIESTLEDTDWDRDDLEGPVIHSGVLNLNSAKSSMDNNMDSTAGRLLAWNQETSELINGAVTQLNTAHAAEFYMDRAGNQKVTLVCPEDYEFGVTDESLVRLRWLYDSSLGIYEYEDMFDTEPVVFISAPHLLLTDESSGKRFHENHYMRSLREVLYGYDDETRHKTDSRGRKFPFDGLRQYQLQVPQLWSLVVGADLIITFSELPSLELQRNLITVDRTRSSAGIYTIRLIDEKDMCRYHVVVKADCKYADFLKHAMALAFKGQGRLNAAAFVLVDDSFRTITADIWLDLLASETIENYVFSIREKHEGQRGSNDEFRALSEKLLTAGSRSSLGSRRDSRRSSFRSESRAANFDMQMVLHPGMWEYGGDDSPSPSEDGLEFEDDLLETSTMSFESHLGVDNSSLDGTVDLTTSMSETSFRLRNTATFDSSVSLGGVEVPKLFKLGKEIEHPAQPNGVTGSPKSQPGQSASNGINETRFTLPRRQTSRSFSNGAGGSDFTPDIQEGSRRRRSRSRSRTSSFTYARDSPLEAEPLPNWFNDQEHFRRTRSDMDASSYHGSWTRPTPDREFGTGYFSAGLPSLNLAEMDPVPFLAWRLTWDDDKRSKSEIEQTVSQLLGKLNATMESEKVGKWYKASFECTKDELIERLAAFPKVSLAPSFQMRDASFIIRQLNPNVHVYTSFQTDICQGLRWSIDEHKETDEQSWFISRTIEATFPYGESASVSGTRAQVDCDDCDELKDYLSPEEALEHWHKIHMRTPCQHQTKKGRVFDDPCFVWIRRQKAKETWTVRPRRASKNDVASSLDLFYGELEDIVDRIEELHKLVTSVTGLEDSTSCNDGRPHLPSSLVEAFERIVALFILKAKEISWMNRFAATSESSYGQHAEQRLLGLKRSGAATSERVRNHLDRAKEDIILLGTSKGDTERIIIAPIGPEFLAASLISHLQNNISVQGTDEKLDLISHYRNYTARLRFNTNRKPKREAFVEIHALEEELEALQMVVASQQGLLRAYQKLFSPLTFKYPTTDWMYYKERKSLFKLESKCVRRQQRRLAERDRALGILRKKVRVLRDDTKQRIEILDEGHGKAIRVFTIVTLFFLPLSFVTSFFGMNTIDIRDTNYDQRMFWTSALPLTFGVIGLAFLYGYKWDLIAAWATGTFTSAKKGTTTHDFPKEKALTWTTTAEQKDDWLPNHGRASVLGWRYRISYLSARQRQRKGRVPRKKTEDSLFRP
ncbi:hypothetical protein CORC01_00653 [Colletotrichum orchidophilum]|uniref:DUF8035 domain-containing protein n=1 Tax=Colletotrichum orchidophilum TaxID=1209926 RepID=A0A1G4BSB3_9PEZI|nr:uncharacterized protein CORC01_00653 [Colletotrichum orchidophilum]OHF04314.1 hypothetical protein CORC01_00653 [Colletotrichum orchidophilum]